MKVSPFQVGNEDICTYNCCSFLPTVVTLDSYQVCQGLKVDIYWASKNKAILVVGRGADDRRPFQDCSIVIGAATAESSLLQLNFEAFHIKDCGVSLSINQSSKSDFTTGNSVLVIYVYLSFWYYCWKYRFCVLDYELKMYESAVKMYSKMHRWRQRHRLTDNST